MTDNLHYSFRNTSLGLVVMAATPKGICLVEVGDDESELLSRLRVEFPKAKVEPATAANCPQLTSWIETFAQHLNCGADLPDLPLDIRGSEFEVQVWNALKAIPEGEVLGYSQLAENIGRPSAVRAVASACGRNRIAVLIPCHRVLRGNGQLGGYRWGISRKQALLDVERARRSDEHLAQAAG